MKTFRSRSVVLSFAGLFLLLFTSCAEFHVQVPVTNDPATGPATPGSNYNGSVTTWSFFWGLLNDGGVPVSNCTECGMQEVTTTRDFWQGLCSLLTLGIATPMNVQWKCQAAPAREGSLSSLPGPGPASRASKDTPIPQVALNGRR